MTSREPFQPQQLWDSVWEGVQQTNMKNQQKKKKNPQKNLPEKTKLLSLAVSSAINVGIFSNVGE